MLEEDRGVLFKTSNEKKKKKQTKKTKKKTRVSWLLMNFLKGIDSSKEDSFVRTPMRYL